MQINNYSKAFHYAALELKKSWVLNPTLLYFKEPQLQLQLLSFSLSTTDTLLGTRG